MKICALRQKNSAENCATLFSRSNKMYTRKNISKKHQQFKKCSRFWSQQIKKVVGGERREPQLLPMPSQLFYTRNKMERRLYHKVMTCKNIFTRAIQSSLRKFWLLIVLCPEDGACSTKRMPYTSPLICRLKDDFLHLWRKPFRKCLLAHFLNNKQDH